MNQKEKATEAAPQIDSANVHNPADLAKVLNYFRHTVGTTLDCMFDTGILRNSITYYVSSLETAGLLQAIYKAPDRRTHCMAKHYSADPSQWIKAPDKQLSIKWED